VDLIVRHVLENEYWNRAWVVQEIILAQKVIVTIDFETHSFTDLAKRIRLFDIDVRGTPFQQFDVIRSQSWVRRFHNESLLFLLHWFRKKQCGVPLDRVFSLLAICREDEKVQVDYNLHWTELATRVLRNTKATICACSAAMMAETLSPSRWSPGHGHQIRIATCTFDVIHLAISARGYVSLGTHFKSARGCVDLLKEALNHELTGTSLKANLKEYRSAHGDCTNLSTALRGVLDSKKYWKYQLSEFSFRWCSFANGWSLGVCNERPNTCSVRISLSKLQKVIPVSTFCDLSLPRASSSAVKPFNIENVRIEEVSVDEEGFMAGARFGLPSSRKHSFENVL
jgi:hypothetical protein